MKATLRRSLFSALVLLAGMSVLAAQDAKIDARINVLASDTGNYLNWSLGSDSIKDKFDATSSASLAGSTASLDRIRYDANDTKKAAIPVGFRELILFPVADYKTLTDDALTVADNGNGLVVRYVHRGVAYELVTDKNGKFDILTGAKSAKDLATNVGGEFVLKAAYLKNGGDPKKMSSLDWSRIKLVSDAKDPKAKRWYTGSLDFALEKGILTVKGNLAETKK